MSNWKLKTKNGVKYFKFYLDYERLQCLFITKIGGLNFPSENPKLMQENLNQIEKNFGIKQINILKQTHSDRFFYVPENFKFNYSLEGDGLFTDQTSIYLGIRVADCLPIYLFSQSKRIIGIVHSGWKGTLQEIGKKIVLKMMGRFNLKSTEINFAFGPSIGACCYEINKDLALVFKEFAKARDVIHAVTERGNKYFLDLKSINEKILENTGVQKAGSIDLCSFCDKDLLFSARRNDLNNRNLALIGFHK